MPHASSSGGVNDHTSLTCKWFQWQQVGSVPVSKILVMGMTTEAEKG